MKSNGKLILKKAGMISLSTLLFALCSILIYATKTSGGSTQQNQEPIVTKINENINLDESIREKMSDYWTVSVFGVDSRNGDLGRGSSADAQLICSINKVTGDIRLVSLYRDTYLKIDPMGSTYGKLSQSYFSNGPAGNASAISLNLDIAVDDYIAFNWKAVADAINILGGVDVDLSKAEFYFINSFITETVSSTGVPSNHLAESGLQHLDGVQAVAYMRLRLMDTDYNRTERQRNVMNQVFNKMKASDPVVLYQLLDAVIPQIGMSINEKDIMEIIINIKNYNISQTTGFPFQMEEASLGKLGACVIPSTLESNVSQLHQFLYGEENYSCSEQVKEISREIIKDAVKN